MKRALPVIIVGALYVLHQDFWFWRTANPLVFGFIPVGLFYHACYTIAVALVLWFLVRKAWPTELEERVGDGETGRGGEPPELETGVGDGATKRVGEPGTSRPVALSTPRPLPHSPRRPVAPSPPRPLASSQETDAG